MMKMLRYICFFLSLALLLPLIASCSDGINIKLAPGNSAVAVRTLEVDRFNIGKDRFYGFRSLSSANFEECKNVLISDMKNYHVSCDVSAFMIKTDQFADIFVELLNENPDLFYVSQSFSYNYDQNEYVKKVFLTYTLDGKEVTDRETLDAAVDFYNGNLDAIISMLPEGLDDYGKTLWLHDYICLNFRYDNTLEGSNAYHMFKYGCGVCQAYTDVFMSLLKKCGIECYFSVSLKMKHIWNQVKIAGDWYHIDVTWDDAGDAEGNDVPGRALHTYFLLSDAAVSSDHYDYVGKKCNSTFYDDSLIHGITSPLTFNSHGWFYANKSEKQIDGFNQYADESELLLSINDYWYVWGSDSSAWNGYFGGVASVKNVLFYSTASKIYFYDFDNDISRLAFEYTENEGYIYGMWAKGDVLYCRIEKNANESDYNIVSFTVDDSIISAVEETTLYENLSAGSDGCSSLFNVKKKAFEESLSVIMIGNVHMISCHEDVTLVVTVETSNGEKTIILGHQGDNPVSFYKKAVAEGVTYIAEEGCCIFGIVIDNIPSGEWISVKSELVDNTIGETLYETFFENPDFE